MWPFRRKREVTLNEMLLREAGLDAPPQPQPAPSLDPFPTTPALLEQPAADAVVTLDAPDVLGDTVEFVVLPSGDVVVEREEGDGDLAPFAEAIEEHLPPPYRAFGRRERGGVWSVSANRILVVHIDFDDVESLDLVSRDSERALTADGEPADGTIPELERIGGLSGGDYAVHAERLDGDLWEVRAAAL